MQVRTLWKDRTYRRRGWQNCGMINILLILEVRWTIAKERMVKVRDFTQTCICVPGLLAQIGHQLLIMMSWGKPCMYVCVTENKGDRSGWPRIISSSVLVAYQGASLITVWTKKAQLSNWCKQLTSGASPHLKRLFLHQDSCPVMQLTSSALAQSPLSSQWDDGRRIIGQENRRTCVPGRGAVLPPGYVSYPCYQLQLLMDPRWRAGYNSEPPGTAFL